MMEELYLSKLIFKEVISPNHWKGRNGWNIKAIVLHITDSNLQSAIRTITNTQTEVSYHYIVDKQGRIWHFVDDEDTAWHAGKVVNHKWELLIEGTNPNYYTIGIACEGLRGEKANLNQLASLIVLLFYLLKIHNIFPSKNTLVYHREIRADKTCPDIYVNKNFLLTILVPLFTLFKLNK